MDEADSHCLQAMIDDLLRYSARPVLVELDEDLALEVQAAGDLEDVVPSDQRLRLAVLEVVHRGTRGASEKVDVAEAIRRHDARLGAPTGEKCIEPQRRAVHERRDLVQGRTGGGEAVEDSLLRVGRRRGHLVEGERAGSLSQGDDIRKRAADINGDSGALRHVRSRPFCVVCAELCPLGRSSVLVSRQRLTVQKIQTSEISVTGGVGHEPELCSPLLRILLHGAAHWHVSEPLSGNLCRMVTKP